MLLLVVEVCNLLNPAANDVYFFFLDLVPSQKKKTIVVDRDVKQTFHSFIQNFEGQEVEMETETKTERQSDKQYATKK